MKSLNVDLILTIEQAGSIREAAAILGRSQPAVSNALRQTEADLGMRIFERGPRGVTATSDGVEILRRARIVQIEMRRLEEEIAQRRGELSGDLSVIASPLAAARLIPPVMRRFRRRFPGVHVQLNGGNAPASFRMLKDAQCDIVVGPAPDAEGATGLSVRPLFRTPISVITGSQSRHAGARSLDDLKDADWLLIGPKDRRPVFANHFRKLGRTAPVPLTTSDSIIALLSMIEESDLCATFPTPLVQELEARWRILRIDLKDEFQPLPIAAATVADRPLTPAGQHFLDCLIEIAHKVDGVLPP